MGLMSGDLGGSPLDLAYPSRPTMIWSCTEISSGCATLTISFVIAMSTCDGVESPEG
jgi:hypothetical protein